MIWLMVLLLQGFAVQQTFAVSNYEIQGSVRGMDRGKVYLKYGENGMYRTFDSAEVNRGQFKLKGKIAEAQLISVYLHFDGMKAVEESKYSFQLFLTNQNKLLLNGHRDSLNRLIVQGGKANDLYQQLLSEPGKLLRSWTYQLSLVVAAEQQEDLKTAARHKKLSDSLRNVFLKTIKSHSDFTSTVQGVCLFSTAYKYIPMEDAGLVLQTFDKTIQPSIYFQRMMEDLNRRQRLQTGMMSPDFLLPDTSGKLHQLKDFRGKYVLLDFGASWCYWCKKETPFVLKAYEDYKDKGLIVVNISLDTDRKLWLNDVKKENHPWLSLCDLQGWKGKVSQDYYVKGVPQILLIDPEGKIIANGLRGAAIGRHLEVL
jgi:peroxiredoxin